MDTAACIKIRDQVQEGQQGTLKKGILRSIKELGPSVGGALAAVAWWLRGGFVLMALAAREAGAAATLSAFSAAAELQRGPRDVARVMVENKDKRPNGKESSKRPCASP
jgi:hypothetical protein